MWPESTVWNHFGHKQQNLKRSKHSVSLHDSKEPKEQIATPPKGKVSIIVWREWEKIVIEIAFRINIKHTNVCRYAQMMSFCSCTTASRDLYKPDLIHYTQFL